MLTVFALGIIWVVLVLLVLTLFASTTIGFWRIPGGGWEGGWDGGWWGS